MARSPRSAAAPASPAFEPVQTDASLSTPLPDDEWGDDESGEDLGGIAATAPRAEPEQRTLEVPLSAQGQRLDAFLAASVPEYSRSHLKTLIDAGCVQVNGQPATSASRKVMLGQVLTVLLKPTAMSQAFVPEPMDLDVVFEDEHLMVINKPAGLVVHPAAGNWSGTLMNGLLAHHAGAVDLPRAGIVHRLDKDTSGLMVVGKSLVAITALSRAIAAREVSRQYLALVQGVVAEASFTVESSIGRDPVTRVRMAVVPAGKAARTDVKRLLWGEWAPDQSHVKADDRRPARAYSGVLCTLRTGRTHQIRVHLSSRRHPLVADALYGGLPALGMTRQALHAARLSFVHPITGQNLRFEAPLPDDMAQAWALLEASAHEAAQNLASGA
ncbi:MAG: RluA family pseudouridine synthase [Aquabacterium sp.]|uniref:RluA family pseudouridine synthase n=1 Tax=Aquabacterium sp. TaxID=1872578 RepID=UPI002A36D735|nr:RluA family pseudouridine synthase [Aquabacterium sp.]MDX9842390.1 RluA family pseudouridine synthase [Aquabacterium sp.]